MGTAEVAKVYRNPLPTVDAIITNYGKTHIVLVKRKNDPVGWALPGGFVNEGESCEKAVIREALEETTLRIMLREQFYTYSSPLRDPRKHIMTTVFTAVAAGTPMGSDDADDAKWFAIDDIPWEKLVFDHATILQEYLIYKDTGQRPSPLKYSHA